MCHILAKNIAIISWIILGKILGKVLARSWPELGRDNLGILGKILGKSWESSWQVLGRFWASLGQVLGRNLAQELFAGCLYDCANWCAPHWM